MLASGGAAIVPQELSQLTPDQALEAYREAARECGSQALTEEERTRYLEPHIERFERALETYAGRSTNMGTLSPATSSETSVAAEGMQIQASSQLSGPSKSIGKVGIGWLKRTIRQHAARSLGGS